MTSYALHFVNSKIHTGDVYHVAIAICFSPQISRHCWEVDDMPPSFSTVTDELVLRQGCSRSAIFTIFRPVCFATCFPRGTILHTLRGIAEQLWKASDM